MKFDVERKGQKLKVERGAQDRFAAQKKNIDL
jgi:hypothetical protein